MNRGRAYTNEPPTIAEIVGGPPDIDEPKP